MHVARRDGLPPPIPVTYRFPDAPATDETGWQEQVVGHLGVTDWQRIDLTGELDVLGPAATEQRSRLGFVWPPNAHFFWPALARTAGGTLLTGNGGDELLGTGEDTAARAVLTGRTCPRPRHLRAVGLAVAPTPLRRRVLTGRPFPQPWLTPDATAAVAGRRGGWAAHRPWPWDLARCRWWWCSRSRQSASLLEAALTAATGTRVVSPFLDPAVVSALAGVFGHHGPATRTESVRMLAGDLLPAAVVARHGKASFDGAFVTERARSFAATWDGRGLAPEVAELVDATALASAWTRPDPDPRALTLLQHLRFCARATEHRLGRPEALTRDGDSL